MVRVRQIAVVLLALGWPLMLLLWPNTLTRGSCWLISVVIVLLLGILSGMYWAAVGAIAGPVVLLGFFAPAVKGSEMTDLESLGAGVVLGVAVGTFCDFMRRQNQKAARRQPKN